MIHGSCLCREVRWRYSGILERITHCHCEMCRKAHASAFASYAIGTKSAFAFECGENSIRQYESSPGFIRSFCQCCGSVVPNDNFDDIVAMPAGGLEDSLGIEPSAHIFAKWKAPWHVITDDLAQHNNYPDQPEPAVVREPTTNSSDDILRGSCLCGDVAYEVKGEFDGVFNCHCSRCQKTHAAAHATNGFTAIGNVRFTRGEEKLVHFYLEEAKLFRQIFCGRCGSGMPQIIEEIPGVVVPFGTLDDDPNRTADCHIHMGSKSSWYPITDDLPRFKEGPDKKK
jgi:hypothetical protein